MVSVGPLPLHLPFRLGRDPRPGFYFGTGTLQGLSLTGLFLWQDLSSPHVAREGLQAKNRQPFSFLCVCNRGGPLALLVIHALVPVVRRFL